MTRWAAPPPHLSAIFQCPYREVTLLIQQLEITSFACITSLPDLDLEQFIPKPFTLFSVTYHAYQHSKY